MQHEITTAQPLLDENGNLRQAGYCKKLLPVYRRGDIKAGAPSTSRSGITTLLIMAALPWP